MMTATTMSSVECEMLSITVNGDFQSSQVCPWFFGGRYFRKAAILGILRYVCNISKSTLGDFHPPSKHSLDITINSEHQTLPNYQPPNYVVFEFTENNLTLSDLSVVNAKLLLGVLAVNFDG